MLKGVTVLDLASVGPAARTSRWLADYGARVVKVGPPPKQSGVQIVPPFYAYSGHRGMERVLLDLKHASGRDAFLKLTAHADVRKSPRVARAWKALGAVLEGDLAATEG